MLEPAEQSNTFYQPPNMTRKNSSIARNEVFTQDMILEHIKSADTLPAALNVEMISEAWDSCHSLAISQRISILTQKEASILRPIPLKQAALYITLDALRPPRLCPASRAAAPLELSPASFQKVFKSSKTLRSGVGSERHSRRRAPHRPATQRGPARGLGGQLCRLG